jgi:glyoxylase-like metal-dependent hydrolase (beta-lactamase superfamily II)
MRGWFEVSQLEDGLWVLDEPHGEGVHSYLVEGEQRSVLVDTGLGIGDIREAVSKLSTRPLSVVNTHAHFDHIGGSHLFPGVAAHRDEVRAIEAGVPNEQLGWVTDPASFLSPPPVGYDAASFHVPAAKVSSVLDDGDVIDLGGRRLEILHTPGHSAGSICLWEAESGLLFSADTVYDGNLFVCLPDSDFDAYRASMTRLAALSPRVRLLLTGHGPTPLKSDVLARLQAWVEEVAAGQVRPTTTSSPWGTVRVYQGGRFSLVLPG